MGVSKIRSREGKELPPGFIQHIFKMDFFLARSSHFYWKGIRIPN